MNNTREHFLKEKFECAKVQYNYEICVEKLKFLRNSEVPLSVGKKFIYEVIENGGRGTDKYTVERIEKINGNDYYVVRRDFYFVDKSKTIINDIDRAWYNTETGEVIKIEFNESQIVEGKVAEFIVSDTWNFAPWMLALNDNFEQKFKYRDTYTKEGQIDYKNYKVAGKEKINGRETFKVKITSIVNFKKDNEEYWWIDAQKRILVKTSIGRRLIEEQ